MSEPREKTVYGESGNGIRPQASPPLRVAPHPLDLGRGWTRRWRLRAPLGNGALPLLDQVLAIRGLTAQAASFLDPKLTQLHDPASMPDMDRAAKRLLDACAAGDPIVIYGDYDADGITATTILFHTLRGIQADARVSTYVPHRIDEGYGLSGAAITQLAAEGAKVIVSVDCGITAIEPAEAALAAGVDLIITDHHNPPASMDDLPRAFAVVHPRRPDSAYPFGDLCGAGVAFKLAWRLATMHGAQSGVPDGRAAPHLRALLLDLLAPAALGAIADIVPLLGENRVIARFGLDRIKSSPLLGLRALVEASGLSGAKVDAWDVGFKLAPRLNACGRMAHAREAVEMLTIADAPRAKEIAESLTELNTQRRGVEKEIFEQAAAMAVDAGMTSPDRRAIVLAHPDWHAGVVGIVCSRLVERFGRPTILMCDKDGSCHGSGRSIEGFNLHAGIAACSELLQRFGGHDMAAGLALESSKLPEFVARFTSVANAQIAPEQLTALLEIDALSSATNLSLAAVRQLQSLAPFGRSNPPVALLLQNLIIDAAPVPLGQSGRHLALVVRDQGERAARPRTLRLVAWNWGEHLARLARGMTVDTVIRPNISTYLGRESIEPELLDLRSR